MPSAAEVSASHASRAGGSDRLVAAGIGLFCLGLYVATLHPGLAFPVMDGHELTVNALRLGVPHPSGYPLYTWAGFVFAHVVPLGDPAWRMNLFSAVCAAAAAGLLHGVGRQLGLRPVAAAAGALLFGCSTELWRQAVMAEVYAPDALMVSLFLWLLLRWADAARAGADATGRFVAFAAVFGASLGTHISNLGFAPAIALFVLVTDPGILRRRALLLGFAAFCCAAAQYLWLPLRGARFDQYPNQAPVGLAGVWAYTLGAFSNRRFEYPVGLLPLRFISYMELLRDNVGLVGVALGSVGSWVALGRRPEAFWLLMGMVFTNVFVFAQFAVFDLQVFFIAGYLPWCLLVAWGLDGILGLLDAAGRRWPGADGVARLARGAVAAAVFAYLAATARAGLAANDGGGDVLVDDFGRNVFAVLPRGSQLTARRGAFGADMLYWQRQSGRDDVGILGQLGNSPPRDPNALQFTTARVADGRPTPEGRMGYREADLPPDAWYVPVLLGNAFTFTLSQVTGAPPELAAPAVPADAGGERRAGDVVLAGTRVAVRGDAAARRIAVTSWWRPPGPGRVVVTTRLGGVPLESHELGLGNRERYAATVGFPEGALLHETYEVVVPSTLPAGTYPVELGVVRFGDHGFETTWLEAGRVDVP